VNTSLLVSQQYISVTNTFIKLWTNYYGYNRTYTFITSSKAFGIWVLKFLTATAAAVL